MIMIGPICSISNEIFNRVSNKQHPDKHSLVPLDKIKKNENIISSVINCREM